MVRNNRGGAVVNTKIMIDKLQAAIVGLKGMDRKKISIPTLITGALVIIAIFALSSTRAIQPAHEQDKPISVSALTVQPTEIEAEISAAGALSSKNSSVLSSKVMGRVSYLGVREGDRVTTGKLLMKIESGEIAAQVYQADSAYRNAKLHYNRIKTLFDEKASTQMEMDQATLALETAESGLNAAKAMESYTIITAPISGQIVEKKINPGEMAMPGQPLLKIEDNRNLRLEVTLNEQDLRYIHPETDVRVQIDAIPGKAIHGRVGQIVPAADTRTHSFIAKIDVPAEPGLITGMYGKAFFSTGKRTSILIPQSAVVTMSGISGVYIVSPEGNALFQMVQVGETRGDSVEAVTGLKPGDRVIVNKPAGVIEGKKVMLAENGK